MPRAGTSNRQQSASGTTGRTVSMAAVELPDPDYHLLLPSQLADEPSVKWLVRGVLPAAGLGLMYGASGAGKSFLVLDLLLSIACGDSWFGRATCASPVIYVCLEGGAGLSSRLRAWKARNERKYPDSMMRIVAQPFGLNRRRDVQRLTSAITEFLARLPVGSRPPLIVVDTLNRAMPGGDENGSSDMGETLAASQRLVDCFGGLVLLVHHSGKDSDRGPRGHSSLLAAADVSMFVSRRGTARTWEIQKSKDGVDGIREAFELHEISLGQSDEGEALTSCIVQQEKLDDGMCRPVEFSEAVRVALVSLHHAFAAVGTEVQTPLATPLLVPLDEWREAFKQRCTAPTMSGKRTAWSRSQAELTRRGFVTESERGLELQPDGAALLSKL